MSDPYAECDIERVIEGVWFPAMTLEGGNEGLLIAYPECDGGGEEFVEDPTEVRPRAAAAESPAPETLDEVPAACDEAPAACDEAPVAEDPPKHHPSEETTAPADSAPAPAETVSQPEGRPTDRARAALWDLQQMQVSLQLRAPSSQLCAGKYSAVDGGD